MNTEFPVGACVTCGQFSCRCEYDRLLLEVDDDFDDDVEPDEWEEAAQNCHGFFDPNPETGVFSCGAAGSEDCDECPMNAWCGLTNREIDEMDDTDTPISPSANHR